MAAAMTELRPYRELTPGFINHIHEDVRRALLAIVAKELNLNEDQLLTRNVRPVLDLKMYSTGTTDATVEDWVFTTAATTTTGFVTVTGDKTMTDNRFVALYGIRDARLPIGTIATAAPAALVAGPSSVSLVRINVGGADRVIWDTKVVQGYGQDQSAFAQAAVIIPQNASFNISYYKSQATASMLIWLQLVGIVCEPRGKTFSP